MSDFWNKIKMMFSKLEKNDSINEHYIIKKTDVGDNMDFENKPDIIKELRSFPVIKVFESLEDISTGLLKYKDVPHYVAFLFKFKDEEIRRFHTVNMMFDIDIMFYDKKGKLIKKAVNVKPGTKSISSDGKCKYVVEIKS